MKMTAALSRLSRCAKFASGQSLIRRQHACYRLFLSSNAADFADSQERPSEGLPPSEVDMLLDAMVRHVPLLGWSDAAISAALNDLGWSPAAKGLLQHGPASAVLALTGRFNRVLAEDLHTRLQVEETRPERAEYAIKTRIQMATPYHHTWPQALGLLGSPQILPRYLKSSAMLADEFAHYAGYKTTDVRCCLQSILPL